MICLSIHNRILLKNFCTDFHQSSACLEPTYSHRDENCFFCFSLLKIEIVPSISSIMIGNHNIREYSESSIEASKALGQNHLYA